MATSFSLRPRSISGILDSTFSLYRGSFIPLVVVSALSQIPLGLLQAWYQPTLNQNIASLMFIPIQSSLSSVLLRVIQSLLVVGLFFLVSALATAITQAALTSASRHTLSDETPYIIPAYRLGLSRYLAILTVAALVFLLQVSVVFCGAFGGACLLAMVTSALSLLARLLLFGGGIVLIGLAIASLYFQIRLQLLLPTIVIEHVRPFKAIARSWSLTRRAFWRAVGFLCAVSFCYYICILVPVNLASYFIQQQTVSLIVRYSSLILATPIISIAYTLFYYDLRIRNEGYDLEVQIQEITTG
jgi:hypothetical protein